MEKLYEKIHEKIKFIAFTVFVLGAIGSVIYAIVLYSDYEEETATAFLFLGPIVSYISSVFIYGFGDLIEKLSEIKASIAPDSKNEEATTKLAENPSAEDVSAAISEIQNSAKE